MKQAKKSVAPFHRGGRQRMATAARRASSDSCLGSCDTAKCDGV